MASRKKPGKYPEWLLDQGRAFPRESGHICTWLCSGCGAPYRFSPIDGQHGGPERGLDRRYSRPFEGPCYRSGLYGVKCVTPKGLRYLYHEGAPNPAQPEQPDLENIQKIIETRGGRRSAKGQQ